tara:strand:- start:3422 stop:3631 length:210 start_codon:yes stop_codon:yes gene_type:complete
MIKASRRLHQNNQSGAGIGGYHILASNLHNRLASITKTAEGWEVTHESGKQKIHVSYQAAIQHITRLGW